MREQPSSELAEFITSLEYADLPETVVRSAERCISDTVGVTLAGAGTGAGDLAARLATTAGSTTLIGHQQTAPLQDALVANGTAGHGLDYDDVCWGMDGHPSVTLVPALLGVGELEDVSGRELIKAYVIGFEAECHLAGPISPGHYERGWHATSTFGVFGAAAATASLLDADWEASKNALNVAASMPSGLKRNFGSMTKPLHVGHAVRSGVTAAMLATEGFTADRGAIGGEGGFWELYEGEGGIDRDAHQSLGEDWAIRKPGVHVKKFPCCHFIHTSIAAVVDLVTRYEFDTASIDRIDVTASQGAADALPHDDPTSGLEAKFSMPFTVAAAVVGRSVSLDTFESDSLDDPEIRAVSDRVELRVDSDLGYDSLESQVRVVLDDGSPFEKSLESPPGSPDNPLTNMELREKFEDCADRALSPAEVDESWAALDSLREQSSTRDLLSVM